MKKESQKNCLFLLLIVTLLMTSWTAKSQSRVNINGLIYDLTDYNLEAQLIDLDRSLISCVIPATVTYSKEPTEVPKTYKVTELSPYLRSVFNACPELSSVKIESTYIPNIPEKTFFGCTQLISVELPKTMVAIGYSAFKGCVKLNKVNIPEHTRIIQDSAFYGCQSLPAIEILSYMETIGSHAFQESGIKEIVIPDNVVEVGFEAFCGCKCLSKVTVSGPKKLPSVFKDCIGLTDVTLSEGIVELNGTFWGCTNLKNKVNIPKSVRKMSGTFKDCINLESIIVPDNVADISAAFAGCVNLTKVNIPANIIEIQYNAFDSCIYLPSIKIPTKVEKIAEFAFRNCRGLKELEIPDNVTEIEDRSSYYGCENLETLTITGNVKSVPSIEGCFKLRTVNLKEGILSVGDFSNCTSLENIKFPSTVTKIGAFLGCTRLRNVNLSAGLIEQGGFRDCDSLRSIVFPEKIENIGMILSCKSLSEIKMLAKNPPKLKNLVFSIKYPVIYVPKGVKNVYSKHPDWSVLWGWNTNIDFIEEGSMPFPVDYSGLKYIEIPSVNTVPDDRMLSITLEPKEGYSLPYLKSVDNTNGLSVIIGDKTLDYSQSIFTYDREAGRLEVPNITDTVKIVGVGLSRDSLLNMLSYQISLHELPINLPDFKKDKYNYEVALPASMADGTEIFLTGILSDERATLAQGDKVSCILKDGMAVANINVIAEDRSCRTSYHVMFYTVNMPVITYKVSYQIEHLVIPDSVKIIFPRDTLRLHLVPDSGYKLPDTVSIQMGFNILDSDSDYVYNKRTGALTIPLITGNVVVIAKATYRPLTPGEDEEIKIDSDSTYMVGDNSSGKFNGTIGDDAVTTEISKLTFQTQQPVIISLKNVSVQDNKSNPDIPTTNIDVGSIVTLQLIGKNSLGYLKNSGSLTLKAERGLDLSLNQTTVVNEGVMVDETGLLAKIGGKAAIQIITPLPSTSEVLSGSSIILEPTANGSEVGSLSYEWEQYDGTKWEQIQPQLSIQKKRNRITSTFRLENNSMAQLEVTEAGQYRCRITNTVGNISSTLTTYTTVSVKSSEPDPVYYTVNLPVLTGAIIHPSAGEHTVLKGASFSFTLTLEKDYDLSVPVVKANNLVIEPDINGTYVIRSINANTVIDITSIVMNPTVGLDKIDTDTTKVWSRNGNLYIHTNYSTKVHILNFGGHLLKVLSLSVGDTQIILPEGMYLVCVGEKVFKVTL